ncbi:MAG: LysE family translocator [Alistipes putredinis]|nr:MAG: LysE family translocator [Alistipes putredinis]
MWIEIFLRGVVIGLTASITLGPVGILCIQRTLSKNRKSGLVSGLGAATADTIFATVAFFFISFISSLIESNMVILTVLGGICVVVVGVNIFMTNPVVQIRRNRAGKSNLWQDYISTFLLTLTNPAFILWLVVIFTALGVDMSEAEVSVTRLRVGVAMITGFLAGASVWWVFLLTTVINRLRNRFRPRHLLWINRVAGVIIVVLGASAVLAMFIQNMR